MLLTLLLAAFTLFILLGAAYYAAATLGRFFDQEQHRD